MKSEASPRTETAVAEPPERSREPRYRQAAELLREWKDDETGYDDQVWPLVEEELAAMDFPERLATLRRQKRLT